MEPLSSEVKQALARNFPSPREREVFRASLKRNEAAWERQKRGTRAWHADADRTATERAMEKTLPLIHRLAKKGQIHGGATTLTLSH